jgi:hypothetical protein
MIKYYFIESPNFIGYKKIESDLTFSTLEGKKKLQESHPNAKIKLVKKKDVANLERFNSVNRLLKEIK